MRVKITLACTECKQRNYNTTKDKKTHPDRMETKTDADGVRFGGSAGDGPYFPAEDVYKRQDEGDITNNPSGRTDGDTTTWLYHGATGLELKKTYADGSCVSKTYDGLNRLEMCIRDRPWSARPVSAPESIPVVSSCV